MRNVLSAQEIGMFSPEDLEEIQQVFQKLCNERGLARGGEGASSLARSILVYYSQGVRDPITLEQLLRAFPSDSRQSAASQ